MIIYRLECHPNGDSWTVEYFGTKRDAERAFRDACRHLLWDVYLDSQFVPSGREALVEAMNDAQCCRTAIDGLTLVDKRVGGVTFRKRRAVPVEAAPEHREGAA